MKVLDNVTVVIVDCVNQGKAIAAINKTLEQITPAMTLFFTDVYIDVPNADCVIIEKITSKNGYSDFMMKKLSPYISTEFVLVIQHDGYPINSDCWTDEFFNYDYIGARWNYPDTERCVGNGGCSLRSYKLIDLLAHDPFIEITEQEDDCIARLYGSYLETKYGIKFAPPALADKFAFELREPTNHTFAFHNYFHRPFINHVVIKRSGACGDLIMVEPLIQYYHEKGYQVVLDTQPELMEVFFNHPFRIKHISEMNPAIVPIKVINLDMSYESKPKQRVLDTYYEFAGITDGRMRNSRLYVDQPSHHRLFKKFIVFHIDRTHNMPYRDVYGVNWEFVNNYYQRLGYTCIQVGKGAHEDVGTYFHTETRQMLLYLLAGADAVCAIDSGVAQISVALGKPTAIFTGSVDLKLRYVSFGNIQVIKNKCPKPELEYCYHTAVSTTGVKCVINEKEPPCTKNFHEWQVVGALNKLLNLN